MKEKWEIKKLGEVCEIVSGSTPKTNIPEYWNGQLKWITPAEITSETRYIYNTERHITQRAIDETGLKPFPKDTVLLSSRAPIGKVAIAGNEMYCNQGFKNLICNKSFISPIFLYYFLKVKNEYLNSLGRGATFKEISKQIVQNVEIHLPPLPIQEAIVKELDVLHRLKDLQEQQLVEYDNLAQSTFYSMFGDPIENEKGWEVRMFGDLFSLKSGDALSAKNIIKGDYPVYGGNGIVGYHADFNTEGKQIIIGRVGALCGNVRLVKEKIWLTDNAFQLFEKKLKFNYQFLTFLLIEFDLRQYAREALQPVISNLTLKNIDVPIPPLPLQTAFAERIEKIEAQKELVKQGIAETQLLIDYTMDKYFG